MANKYKELRSELESIGISSDNMSEGTVNGTPAIFLHKDGDEDQYTGHSEDAIMSGRAGDVNAWLKERFGG